jgi:hypothetical protein
VRVRIVWYSRTGTVEVLAREAESALAEKGHEPSSVRLEPQFELPYLLWLALSFVPGSRFPLRGEAPSLQGFDACLLALPKWTLSCPPVNEFLAARGPELPATALLVACGGWDEERYTEELAGRVARFGAPVLGTVALTKDSVVEGEAAARVRDFVARCFLDSVGC